LHRMEPRPRLSENGSMLTTWEGCRRQGWRGVRCSIRTVGSGAVSSRRSVGCCCSSVGCRVGGRCGPVASSVGSRRCQSCGSSAVGGGCSNRTVGRHPDNRQT
jgi:hypothetical protein